MISDDFEEVDFLARTFSRLLPGLPREPSYVTRGWLPLVTRLLIDLDAMLDDDHAAQFETCRIDDLFGHLRFEWVLGGESSSISATEAESAVCSATRDVRPSALFVKVRERINKAILDSATTCLDCCGIGAISMRNGTLLAMCDECADVRRWYGESHDG